MRNKYDGLVVTDIIKVHKRLQPNYIHNKISNKCRHHKLDFFVI